MFDKKRMLAVEKRNKRRPMFDKFMNSKLLGIIDFIPCHFLTEEICDVISLISFNINRLGITEGDH